MVSKKPTGESTISTKLLRFARNPATKRRRISMYQKSQVSATADGKTSPCVGYLREQNLIALLADSGFHIIRPNSKTKSTKIAVQRDVRLRMDGPSRDNHKTTTDIEIKHVTLKSGRNWYGRVKVTGASGMPAIRRKQNEMLELAKAFKNPAFFVTILYARDATMMTKFFPASAVNRALNKLKHRAFAEIKNEAANSWGFFMSKEFWELAAETPNAWSILQDECDLSLDASAKTWKIRSMRDENFALLETIDAMEKEDRPRPNTRLQVKTRHGNATLTRKDVKIVYRELRKICNL